MTRREKAAVGYDPSVLYGVNKRSALSKIMHFDPARCLPPDPMHCLHEGLLGYVCKMVLVHVIRQKKTWTLNDVNNKVVEYSKYFTRDRPSTILEEHLSPSKKLRQSAAQMHCLAIILPFILRKSTEIEDDTNSFESANDTNSFEFAGESEYLDILIKLLNIVNLVMSYKLEVADIARLRQMMKDFHEQLLVLDPEITMTKLHLCHHLAEMILLFGVLRQVACFRFEAHHSYFKRLIRIIKNFINVTYSLAARHQARQCKKLMNENFLYSGHRFTVKNEVIGLDDRNTAELRKVFPICSKLFELSRLEMHGSVFKKNSIVLLSEEPKFAVIQKIYQVNEESFGFVCLTLKTVERSQEMNACAVSPTTTKIALDALKLIFPHEILSVKSEGKWFAIPLGHRKLLT